MGLRGPQPKSAEMRVLEGERAHRPLPAARPASAYGFPDRPKGMSAAGRRVWDELKSHFELKGYVEGLHATTLQQYCEDFAELQVLQAGKRKAAKKLRLSITEYLVTEDGKSLSREIARISMRLRPLAIQFGLTPLSAMRLESTGGMAASMGLGVPPPNTAPSGIEEALCA